MTHKTVNTFQPRSQLRGVRVSASLLIAASAVLCPRCLAADGHATNRVPAGTLAHAGDYAFGYYPYGWRRPHDNAPIHFAVQTNRYALLLNASQTKIERLGPITAPIDGRHAVAQGNDLLTTLPAAELTFSVIREDRVFPATLGARSPDQLRLFHVGKYLQHFDVQAVQIGGGTSPGLEGISASIEAYCWTDRLAMQMHLSTHKSHLAPSLRFDDVVLAAFLKIPAEYAVVELLGPDDKWIPAKPKDFSESGIAIRNSSGAGIALLCTPGAGQRVRLTRNGYIQIETRSMSLPPEGLTTFPCIIVPSMDVRRDASREIAQMRSASAAQLRISAEGIAPYTGTLRTCHDDVKGWHEVTLGENSDFSKMERVRVRLDNPDSEPRTVRLNFAKIGGGFPITGLSPVLRDTDGWPIGLPVQISKNWHCVPPWFHGLTMLELAPRQHLELEFDLAYAYWGNVPAVSHAQLCLFGYANNQLWDEMAIGSFGESICYDPDVNLGRSMVDDMRPLMVWGMGKKPKLQWSWTHNVGGCDFLTLFLLGNPKRQFLARQKTLYSSYGPVMSDVTYAGQTPDGAIQSQIRTQSWRSDDYVRALYTVRYDVTKPLANIDRLAFFQLGADHYSTLPFRKLARGSANGLDESWNPVMGGRTYSRRSEKLDGEMPWIGMYEADRTGILDKADQGALADKAMIIRSWNARLGGINCATPCYSVYGSEDGGPGALVELSPPKELDSLQPGDFVETRVEVLVLPRSAEDYYGPNRHLVAALKAYPESWALTHREAAGSNVRVSTSTGTIEQTWPVRIRAQYGSQAAFTITGGIGYTPVTISGVNDYRDFRLERVNEDGSTENIDQSSEVGRDWWQANYDTTQRSIELTFTLCLDSPDNKPRSQTYRWSGRPGTPASAASH